MYHFIINPASSTGNGAKIWHEVEHILKERKIPYTAYLTDGVGSAKNLASTLSSRYYKCTLIILGGDGTMNEVLSGIDNYSDVTLGYIPAGSSNDLARDLQLATDPIKAINAILSPKEYAYCDVGVIQYQDGQKNFGVSMGIGYDAAICHEALHSKMKKYLNKMHLGKLTYLYIALKQLAKTQRHSCDIILDDVKRIHLDNYYFVTTMVHKYEGGGFMFCPEADCADGYLDVCAANNISKFRVLSILPTAFSGKHIKYKGIHIYRAKKVQVIASVPACVHTDGESCGIQDNVTMTIAPQQLRIIKR